MSPLAVSVKHAAVLADLSESEIRNAIRLQKLPAHRVGRMIRVFTSDLEDWLRSQPRVGSDEEREAQA